MSGKREQARLRLPVDERPGRDPFECFVPDCEGRIGKQDAQEYRCETCGMVYYRDGSRWTTGGEVTVRSGNVTIIHRCSVTFDPQADRFVLTGTREQAGIPLPLVMLVGLGAVS